MASSLTGNLPALVNCNSIVCMPLEFCGHAIYLRLIRFSGMCRQEISVLYNSRTCNENVLRYYPSHSPIPGYGLFDSCLWVIDNFPIADKTVDLNVMMFSLEISGF